MQYINSAELIGSLRVLKKKGGSFSKAAEKVHAVLSEISTNEPEPLKGLQVTRNNESRIDKCVKYDLPGRSRLVTVQNNKSCILLYAGSHDDADAWIEKNKGKVFKADSDGRIATVFKSAIQEIKSKSFSEGFGLPGRLYEHLDAELYQQLVDGLSKAEIRWLQELRADDYSELQELCSDLEAETGQVSAIYDSFYCLLEERVSDANSRIKDSLGRLDDLDDVESLFSSDKFSVIPRNAEEYQAKVARLIDAESYKSWMLFMHPEQERVACEEFDGPAKLLGVSGSGKTCVVVRRALELHARYPGKDILVLTLNPPLASLIRDLVREAGGASALEFVRVSPLFSICQEILSKKEPENDKHYNEVTWKANEHVDEIWREYYRCELNNYDAACMIPVHDSLISRGIEAEKYIRQEFDWIRSAFPPTEREKYLRSERRGRTYALSLRFRKLLLKGLEGWEKKLWAVGVTDYLGVATAAHKHIEKIKPSYRCVIVDECQDFGTTELSIVRHLVRQNKDDIFLCGDASQQVTSKFQSVQAAGISTHASRIRELKLNYRNSRDILRAAFGVLVENLEEGFFENTDFEVLDPAYADFAGPAPLVLEADTLEDEIAFSLAYIKQLHQDKNDRKALIAIAGMSNFEVGRYAMRSGVDLPFLRPDLNFSDEEIYLSDLEQSKGFEFDTVCIVNCRQDVLPDTRIPDDEQFRDLARFYVTMTRAKKNLIISWSEKMSAYLESAKLEDNFLYGHWRDFVECSIPEMPRPSKLRELRTRHQDILPLLEMNGGEFLYTSNAVGYPSAAIEQIRQYVTGNLRTQGKKREKLEWKTMGSALTDLEKEAYARNRFGRETSAFLRKALRDIAEDGS